MPSLIVGDVLYQCSFFQVPRYSISQRQWLCCLEELALQCLILGKPGFDSTFPGFYATVCQWNCWW